MLTQAISDQNTISDSDVGVDTLSHLSTVI